MTFAAVLFGVIVNLALFAVGPFMQFSAFAGGDIEYPALFFGIFGLGATAHMRLLRDKQSVKCREAFSLGVCTEG